MKTALPILPCCLVATLLCSTQSMLASITEYQAAVKSEPSLISYYTFDAGNANDSQAANNGTVVGNATYGTGVGGGTDKAIVLDGTGHVNLGQVDAFDFVSGYGTVEAWIRADWPSSPGYNPAIFTDRDGGPVNWSVHMEASKAGAGLWNGSSYQPLALAGTGTTWHHLAVVFDFDANLGVNTFTLYWDGVPAGVRQQTIGADPTPPTELGSASASGQERWIGALDEVAFYSEALSAATIQAHYTAFLVGDPPKILTQPAGGTYLAGVPLTLSVEAKGAQLSYQWFKNDAPVAGATSATLTISPLAAGDAGAYRVVVTNPAGQAASDTVQVALGDLPSKLKQYQAAVKAESSLVSLYSFDGLTANDAKAAHDGTLQGGARFGDGIGGAAGKALALDGTGHVNLGEVDAFDFLLGTGTVEAWVRADWTANPGYNPAIITDRDGGPVNWSIHMNAGKDAAGVWNGTSYQPQPTPGTGTAWHHLAVVFDYDLNQGVPIMTLYWDGQPAGTAQQGLGVSSDAPTELGSASAAGQERWIGALDEVAFYSEALSAAAIQAHFAAFVAGDPPVITSQPLGGSFTAGDTVTLSAGAQGVNVSYQWFKDGSPIAGETSATLTFAAIAAGDAGTYKLRATNAAGSVDSDNAVVRVIVPDLAAYKTAVQAEPSLVSYYTFDAANADDAKSSNNGTLQGDAGFTPGVGRGADQALLLGGAGWVNLEQVEAFDFLDGSGTVEAWIRADWTASPGYNPAIFADRNGNPVNWSVHMEASKAGGGLWNGSTYSPLPLAGTGTRWHHLAAVFDRTGGNSTFTLYWDGSPVSTTLQGLGPAPESPTELGSSSPDGQELWIGALDEVAFYSDALPATAILSHYQALLGGPTELPAVQFSLTGKQLTLSWPADATGFTLESADALPATTWSAVPGVVNNRVTIDVSAGTRFYRLRNP